MLLRCELFGVYNTSLNLPGKFFQSLLGRLCNLNRAWALVHLSLEWEGLAGRAKLSVSENKTSNLYKKKKYLNQDSPSCISMVGEVLPAPSFSVIQWQLTKVTHLKLGLAEGSIGKVKRELTVILSSPV